MAQNRPDIPVETQRQVLVECGHRCSVCGREAALEFAHIVPWSTTRDHSATNILVLCASCHSRADREKWGRKTLRAYKNNPWFKNFKSTGSSRVTLEIPNIDLARFGRDSENALLVSLATLLGVRVADIKVIEREKGSVLLTLEMSAAAAERLAYLIDKNDIELKAIIDSVHPSEAMKKPQRRKKQKKSSNARRRRTYYVQIQSDDSRLTEQQMVRIALESGADVIGAKQEGSRVNLVLEMNTTGRRSVNRYSKSLATALRDFTAICSFARSKTQHAKKKKKRKQKRVTRKDILTEKWAESTC